MERKKLSGEVFYPSEDTVREARVPDWEVFANKAEFDYTGFWEREADQLHWFREWDKVLDDSQKPFYKWFVGARTNIVYNCLDRHLQTARRNKLALIWEGGKRRFQVIFLLCPAPGRGALRQCAEKSRPWKRRSGNDLYGSRSRASHCHARLRVHRSNPFRGIRRLYR